jgi:hypothetical protein
MPKRVAVRVLVYRPCMSFSTDCYPALTYIDLVLSTVTSHVSAGCQYRMAGFPSLSPEARALPGSYGVLSLDSASWQWIASPIMVGALG